MRGGLKRVLAFAVALIAPMLLSTTDNSTFQERYSYITGYNTLPAQTDRTPCIAASGANICGRRDAVACPREISLGTVVEIRGSVYVCEDRTARKFDGRFDISCDKDKSCPYEVAGWTTVRVYD